MFEPSLCQTGVDHIKRNLLLGHKEYAFARVESVGNDVGNGLTFTRTWGPLNHHRTSAHHVGDAGELAGIGLGDQDRNLLGNRWLIHMDVFCNNFSFTSLFFCR